MRSGPIGIFDSGIGGLTVARAIFDALPGESILYFGDTARVPYGPKSPRTVVRYSQEILRWLLQQRVKAVVVACNTSTAHALDSLQATSPVPVVGVIRPGAEAAVAVSQSGRIGVVGTSGTIASRAYQQAIRCLAPESEVFQQACPLFVPLVEEGWFDHPAAELVAREYLAPLIQARIDALVLGCTHYPLLKPLLARVLGEEVRLIDSAVATAGAVKRTLIDLDLMAPEETESVHRFVVSDEEARFLDVGRRFIGQRLVAAERVELGEGSPTQTG